MWLFPVALLTGEKKYIFRANILTFSCLISYGIQWEKILGMNWESVQPYRYLWFFLPQISFVLYDGIKLIQNMKLKKYKISNQNSGIT